MLSKLFRWFIYIKSCFFLAPFWIDSTHRCPLILILWPRLVYSDSLIFSVRVILVVQWIIESKWAYLIDRNTLNMKCFFLAVMISNENNHAHQSDEWLNKIDREEKYLSVESIRQKENNMTFWFSILELFNQSTQILLLI